MNNKDADQCVRIRRFYKLLSLAFILSREWKTEDTDQCMRIRRFYKLLGLAFILSRE